ncbi:hypothetical protein BDY24DRAFT_438824 [Mrakia frigida]|uniref:Zn(II)2Cys6 transcription factor domain-containing protein n=1 Tax=Mrakia frigida TaxID=29902 RepID=UPI003FCBF669
MFDQINYVVIFSKSYEVYIVPPVQTLQRKRGVAIIGATSSVLGENTSSPAKVALRLVDVENLSLLPQPLSLPPRHVRPYLSNTSPHTTPPLLPHLFPFYPSAGAQENGAAKILSLGRACQACRIRKSKCDGKHSCIRCEKKGLCCVYTTRPIRPRGKRPNKTESRFSSFSSSSVSSSCTSGHHHPLSPPRIIFKSEREVTPAEKESIGGKWEGEVEGWRDEVRSGSMGAEGARGEWRSTMDVEDGEFSHRIEVEGSHRLQLSEDHHSISPFAAAVPLETSHPTTPPSYNPSKLHQSYTSYPTPSYGQHFQPPPHPSQNQLSLPRRPPSSPGYPPTVRSSEDQINSPFLNYYLVAVSSPISRLQYPPSFDTTQPSYPQSDRRDASSSFVVGPLSSSRFSAHPEQKQQYFSQSTGQELSSSRTQDSSSRWNLGGEERTASTSWPSTFGGPGTLTPAPSVWDGDEWSKLGFSG